MQNGDIKVRRTDEKVHAIVSGDLEHLKVQRDRANSRLSPERHDTTNHTADNTGRRKSETGIGSGDDEDVERPSRCASDCSGNLGTRGRGVMGLQTSFEELPRRSSIGVCGENEPGISVRRTDDGRHHLLPRMDSLYEHLTGFLKWSPQIAKGHMEEQSFAQKGLHIEWSELHHIKEMSYAHSCISSKIHTAVWKGKKVVVKMARRPVDSQTGLRAEQQLEVEHSILALLHHPTIIRLHGAGHNPSGGRFILLEYLSGGSLSTMKSPGASPTLQEKFNLGLKRFQSGPAMGDALGRCLQIARALEYLHDRAVPGAAVLHRDLRPDNFGISEDGHVKLFDFGRARLLKREEYTQEEEETDEALHNGEPCSLRYISPEVALCKPYSTASEVYSISMCMWEIASQTAPFGAMTRSSIFDRVIVGGERPPLDPSWPTPFVNALSRGWDANPLRRPLAREMRQLLEEAVGVAGR